MRKDDWKQAEEEQEDGKEQKMGGSWASSLRQRRMLSAREAAVRHLQPAAALCHAGVHWQEARRLVFSLRVDLLH